MSLHIRQLEKRFGDYVALQNIDLTIGPNEFVCLLGPSSCGKTILLRIIAGLLAADSGSLELDGRNLAPIPASERGFGIVFQSYSLFPYMTVAENVGYGLCIRGRSKADNAARQVRDVVLPVLRPALWAVALFLFMRSMVTLSAVIFLVTPSLKLAAVTVMRLDEAGFTSQAAAFSTCIMAVVGLASLLFSRLARQAGT